VAVVVAGFLGIPVAAAAQGCQVRAALERQPSAALPAQTMDKLGGQRSPWRLALQFKVPAEQETVRLAVLEHRHPLDLLVVAAAVRDQTQRRMYFLMARRAAHRAM
jgi:hypothetical protein